MAFCATWPRRPRWLATFTKLVRFPLSRWWSVACSTSLSLFLSLCVSLSAASFPSRRKPSQLTWRRWLWLPALTRLRGQNLNHLPAAAFGLPVRIVRQFPLCLLQIVAAKLPVCRRHCSKCGSNDYKCVCLCAPHAYFAFQINCKETLQISWFSQCFK